MGYIASEILAARVLEGDVGAIARLITRAEAGDEEARPVLDMMFKQAGRAHIVGITGVPGSGKSTLVAKLTAAVRTTGRKVGIVAIDPSSPFSGGAILGDRIRMGELAGDLGVFVRSMATRGALGGLAFGTLEAVDVLDAAGYDLVVIETVGVGQDEVEVARAAHTTVVVSAPGLGDDIQAIKAGILEIADVHVVSKCDRPDANKTIADLKAMLALGMTLGSANDRWRPPVVATSALRGDGVSEVLEHIDRHYRALCESGEIEARRALIAERRLLRASEEIVRRRFERRRDGHVETLIEAMRRRAISPHTAAVRLLNELSIGGES
jgi:LAO/AO transport system kinase